MKAVMDPSYDAVAEIRNPEALHELVCDELDRRHPLRNTWGVWVTYRNREGPYRRGGDQAADLREAGRTPNDIRPSYPDHGEEHPARGAPLGVLLPDAAGRRDPEGVRQPRTPSWLVSCSRGYERECISAWAAAATRKLPTGAQSQV